jgi:hypothetical protein
MKTMIQLGWLSLGMAAAPLSAPVTASAQEVAAEVAPPRIAPPQPPPADPVPPQGQQLVQVQDNELEVPKTPRIRYRFEGGLDGNFTLVGPNANFGFGNYLRIGAQFKPWIHAQVEAAAGTILFSWYARAALTVGFTPVRWFTVSAGPVVGYFASTDILSNSPPLGEGYAGATVRTDFHVVQYRAPSGRRHSFTLGISSDLGGSLGLASGITESTDLSIAAMFHLGYTAH